MPNAGQAPLAYRELVQGLRRSARFAAHSVMFGGALMAEPQVMAHRLIATALMMKRQFQDAGMAVAREFCREYGISADDIEYNLRQSGKPFGRMDPHSPQIGQIDATDGGKAWFWQSRQPGEGS